MKTHNIGPVLERLNELIAQRGSQAEFSKHSGVSQMYICDVLKGRRSPGPLLLDAIGMEAIVIYRRKDGISAI